MALFPDPASAHLMHSMAGTRAQVWNTTAMVFSCGQPHTGTGDPPNPDCHLSYVADLTYVYVSIRVDKNQSDEYKSRPPCICKNVMCHMLIVPLGAKMR